MRWDEDRFGREYDLDVFMIVAVEDFNFGAMENKGLNIFNTSAILAHKDTATDDRFTFVESVVAHEYFHNWSGNRVTCRDWFQLSLKEGFTVYRDQEFSADMNWPELCRIEDVLSLRNEQFVEDSGPLAHPVRPDSYVEISNFYTGTVYRKGAEVVRMIATLLGRDRFRAGCDAYFDRHDGSAVTIEDFVKAMEDTSGLDLSLFRRWYAQAGTPTLRIRETRSGAALELVVEQTCDPTPGQPTKQPLPIPLALGLVSEGRDVLGAAGADNGFNVSCETVAEIQNPNDDGTLVVRIDQPKTAISFRDLPTDAEVSLLRGFSAPVKVDYPRPPSVLRGLALDDPDVYSRWDAAQSLLGESILAAAAGEEDIASEAITMVRALAAEALAAPDDGKAKALIAAGLALPSESWLLELAPGTDILAIVAARDALAERIADAIDWLALLDANHTGEYKPELLDMARRRLRHQALHYALNHLDRNDADDSGQPDRPSRRPARPGPPVIAGRPREGTPPRCVPSSLVDPGFGRRPVVHGSGAEPATRGSRAGSQARGTSGIQPGKPEQGESVDSRLCERQSAQFPRWRRWLSLARRADRRPGRDQPAGSCPSGQDVDHLASPRPTEGPSHAPEP